MTDSAGGRSEGAAAPRLIVAVDTGGTFTDAVGRLGDRVAVAKVASTPDDPSRAVLAAVARVASELAGSESPGSAGGVALLVHGTTVATNALLEGRGAETWLVTNAGFEDVLAIGRQARASLYALEPANAPTLVPRSRVVGVAGRMSAMGVELLGLELGALKAALAGLDAAPRSWAVCLLHGYANDAHERAVAAMIGEARPQDALSVSSRVLPVFREVERASTTVANAFVQPLMARYLGRLSAAAERVSVMGSSGGRLTLEAARALPALTALSGPAGGVVAALGVARRRGLPGVVAFDMGGTSTDVSLCRDTLPLRFASKVGPFPIHLPMLDIHTVGAGGGSIARVDAGGALVVGPESAGADPGPACYGRGVQATVTDANVVLGHLPADILLGGERAIEAERAHAALRRVGDALGVSAEQAAEGVIAVAVETMARAIRTVSVERGEDPRDFTLCCFGGAGGLHACALADALGMRAVVVPAHAGLLSAVGMLQGRATAERSRTVLGAAASELEAVRSALWSEAERALGEAPETRSALVDMRYAGQSFELSVAFDGDVAAAREAFEAMHASRFGYRVDAAVEAVNVRVRVEGVAPEALHVGEPWTGAPEFTGPAVIRQLASTTWVAPGWRADVEPDGTIAMHRVAATEAAPNGAGQGAKS